MFKENGIEVESLQKNTVEGDIELVNSVISFKGEGNRLIADGKVKLEDCNISFNGDDALLYLCESGVHPYKLRLDLWRETTTYFGRKSYFNGIFTAIVSERKSLIVGSRGVFSFGIWVRTADPHIIYSIDTHKRINPSKSVMIGDHVWIGQNATILKGSIIGSGSIVSAAAVVANKRIESNSIYAGNPAKRIKKGIFFRGNSVHNYTADDTDKQAVYDDDKFIFGRTGHPFDIAEFDRAMCEAGSAEEREKQLRKLIVKPKDKNRFLLKVKNR